MSVLNPVLYGNRLYSQTDYSENPDPQTFNLSFNETISEADSIGNDTTKPLMDALTLLDSYITTMQIVKTDTIALSDAFMFSAGRAFMDAIISADSITKTAKLSKQELVILTDTFVREVVKVLSDTVTSTDIKLFNISKALSEFINSTDSSIVLTISKALTDIVLIQDWISIRLMKPQIWTVAQAPLIGYSTLYGRQLFGIPLYSGLSAIVWIGFQARNTPVTGNGWTNFNEMRNA